jgi:manganese/zinc/iron transport system substrate-binding protein
MVGDIAKSVGGDTVAVTTLMGPGVDPHLYKATSSDIAKFRQADVILYSGLFLEGKMDELFSQMTKTKRSVVGVTRDLPQDKLLSPAAFQGHHDPHVWFDVALWSRCIPTVVKALSEADPANAKTYEANGAATRKKYDALHQWALDRARQLPKERRILVTSHDAFNYFGRAYGFEVVGLQGISTVTEAGLADDAKLVDLKKARKFPAVNIPPAAIERISKDAGVKIGGEVFSDAMGTPGKIENGYDVGTYEGMIKHNLNTIVEALK